jgi:GNAT superfamily N-acetyltransferase
MTTLTTPSSVAERFRRGGRDELASSLILAPGSMRDYLGLCEHHYKAQRPATATRVFALRFPHPGVVGRFLGRRDESQLVGVLVESLPALCCRLRDQALADRYGQVGNGRARALMLNEEVRCISRVVVHPQWRGLGLAVRLVKAALAEPTTIYTEALAAMGRVHPFFAKAGMTAYRRPIHEFDARLTDALARLGLSAVDLARLDHAANAIAGHAHGPWLKGELQRWCKQALRRGDVSGLTLREQLVMARARLLAEPVYFLKDNRGD